MLFGENFHRDENDSDYYSDFEVDTNCAEYMKTKKVP